MGTHMQPLEIDSTNKQTLQKPRKSFKSFFSSKKFRTVRKSPSLTPEEFILTTKEFIKLFTDLGL